jgi:DNA-binding NtrC family response regulator
MKHREIVIAALIARDGNYCKICRNEFNEISPPEIDHIRPKISGGTDELNNLQLSHSICNRRKGKAKLIYPMLNMDLPHESLSFENQIEWIKLTIIKRKLIETKNNKSKAARLLKTSRRQISYLIRKYKLPNDVNLWPMNFGINIFPN